MSASWYSTTLLLGLPAPALLVGPYSATSLSSNSFSSSQPLTSRLRHADLLLYSLLIAISPTSKTDLPAWPPVAHADAKLLRAELSKGVEKVLRMEKGSWEEQITWRRSWLDEAKGERWERCLDCLATVALRRAVEKQELVSELADLGSLTSLSTAEAIVESLSRIGSLYSTEFTATSDLLINRRGELAHLRQERQELLSTRAILATEGDLNKEQDALDMPQLQVLRNERAATVKKGVWELLLTGDPRSEILYGASRSTTLLKRPSPRLPPPPAANHESHSSSSAISSHLSLLSSLSILCHPPPSSSPASISTASGRNLSTGAPPPPSHPSAYSAAFSLDSSRLATLPSPPSAAPPPPNAPLSFPSPSSTSFAHLLRPSRAKTEEESVLEIRVAQLLDSLEVKEVGRDKSAPPRAGRGKSRLPMATRGVVG